MDPAPAPAPAAEGPPLPAALLYAMVFVEGFASLGAEIVALRWGGTGAPLTVTAGAIHTSP